MAIPASIEPFSGQSPSTPTVLESALEASRRLTELLTQAETDCARDRLPDNLRDRIADTLDILRSRLGRRVERDPRSLFDLDDRLIDLMDRIEEATAEGGEVSPELGQEINEYLEAFRGKVDRIAGYWRWQESIAEICTREAERLGSRAKAATGRVDRLKAMLLGFMLPRDLKKLEGEKASIGLQRNGTASLVIDDPLQIEEAFFENSLRFTRAELRDLISQLPEGEARRRMEAALDRDGWEINNSSVRCALTSQLSVPGARLVKGHHVRLR
jgi:Siphovirus Gp157